MTSEVLVTFLVGARVVRGYKHADPRCVKGHVVPISHGR